MKRDGIINMYESLYIKKAILRSTYSEVIVDALGTVQSLYTVDVDGRTDIFLSHLSSAKRGRKTGLKEYL